MAGGYQPSPRTLFWILIPGNLILFLLAPHFWNDRFQPKRTVTKHVYHLSSDEVWRVAPVDSHKPVTQPWEPSRTINEATSAAATISSPPASSLGGGEAAIAALGVAEEDFVGEEGLPSGIGGDESDDSGASLAAPAESDDSSQLRGLPTAAEDPQIYAGTEAEAPADWVAKGASAVSLSLEPQVRPRNPGTFVYQRAGDCRYLCSLIRQTQKMVGSRAAPALRMIRWYDYSKYRHLQNTVINQVGSDSSCIGGGKGKQLRCRQQLATAHGCDFAELPVQPPQWNLQKEAECRKFFQFAMRPEHVEQIWILKPGGSFHGKGITLHKGWQDLHRSYGTCPKLRDGLIVQQYVDKPVLMGGHKFDMRSYLLIASTKPVIAFYADGFIRRSQNAYSTDTSSLKDVNAHITNAVSQSGKNHFFSFSQLQEVLTRESGFDANFIRDTFRPHAMAVTNFLVQSALNRTVLSASGEVVSYRHGFDRTNGRFQMFALDWMLDANGGMHLLEANGDPSVKHYPGIDLTPELWKSMMELVLKIHNDPASLEAAHGKISVAQGFKYSKWHAVTNELESFARKDRYNSCRFREYQDSKHPLFGFDHAKGSE